MTSLYDVQAEKLVKRLAEKLKGDKVLSPPTWSSFVKTGSHKERPPMNPDWWYIRGASILLTIAKNGPVGVSKLRSKYGGRKNRGVKPEKLRKSGGSIIRKLIKQLETAGLVLYKKDTVHKGRIITGKGASLLNSIAKEVSKQ